MEFLVFLFFMYVLFSIVKAAARQASAKQQQLPPPAFYDVTQVPPEHVVEIGGRPVRVVIPERSTLEESSSEPLWDEAAEMEDLFADRTASVDVVSLEPTDVVPVVHGVPTAPPVSLEQEVDWEREHERFHRRYVDARESDAFPAHGLMDELRDPAALRRAVLLAEVLGPPKSARR